MGMLCTSEEARKKWCPLARVSITGKAPVGIDVLSTQMVLIPTSHNRLYSPDQQAFSTDGCYCLARGCMFWEQTHEVDGVSCGYCAVARPQC